MKKVQAVPAPIRDAEPDKKAKRKNSPVPNKSGGLFSFSFVSINDNRFSPKEERKISMTKTKEELNALKKEVETLGNKLAELSEEELQEVSGGIRLAINAGPGRERVLPIIFGMGEGGMKKEELVINAEDHNVML